MKGLLEDCLVCGRILSLDNHGRFRYHKRYQFPTKPYIAKCPGTGKGSRMSYPKMPEPQPKVYNSDEINFVVPTDFPVYAETHMLAIVKMRGYTEPQKYFITLEAYRAIMVNFNY